jgi:hypothetical protein
MQNITRLKQSVIARLNTLPPHKLVQASDFIDFLIERRPQMPATPQGSLDDLLACVGIWEFEPGELESIMQDIEQPL